MPVLELAGIEMPDGASASWKQPAPIIQPAVDRRGPTSPGQPTTRESCPTIDGAEVDHAAVLVDEDP